MSVHLHVRSCYTLLSSTLSVEHIVQLAKQYGYRAVTLCDEKVMHGAMAFYHACKKADIKPLFAMEVEAIWRDQPYRFILIAKNDQGYLSVLKLSTYLNTVQDTMTLEELKAYSSDVFLLTAGADTNLESLIIKQESETLREFLNACREVTPSFVVSIARNDSGLWQIKNQYLKSICRELDIPTCALSRIYFGEPDDEESYQTLCAIKQGVSIQDKTLNYSPKRYFRSPEEMAELYEEEDLKMTEAIADACQVEMNFEKAQLPQFHNKFQVSSEIYLTQLCQKGLAKRMQGKPIPKVYQDRLNYELHVIITMHYADYFLIVWDFIRFARSRDIYVGPGRGSAAGSLVSYCLGITHIDPIQYGLLFERFLNPERISMPDIDTDFPDNRRDEVIEYVREHYGYDHVAHIITFNTLAAKQVLRDVGKALQVPPREVDSLCRMVPNLPKVTLDYTYENVPRFKQMINTGEKYRRLYAISKRLEGLPRHASQHAAGIVFANADITDVCPLIHVDENICATQFTMEYLEELGLIKMDFLGLRNLTIIDEIVSDINASRAKKLEIMKIPLDDARTFQVIQAVDTVGIFQLESEGMKNLIRKMKPRNFEDIVALLALFRPGPMENIPRYLEARAHPEKVDYMHPSLKPILQNTYGVMIYQEQIMQIAQVMAGFSLAKADNMRKAISKKHGDELKVLQQEFIDGAIKRGYLKNLAEHVYEMIMKFANYGFNRSHSVAYALLVYQLAYLKANAPLYFFSSLLNSVIGSETKTSEYLFEARRRGIQILPPSINYSTNRYMIEQRALRFPLTAIKGVGTSVCMQLLTERKEKGHYGDVFDFVARITTCRISRKLVETLIYAGALDDFKMNRTSLIASLDDAFRYGDLVKIEDENQIMIDFDLVSKPAVHSLKENSFLCAEKEKEVLGFYLSSHPISQLRARIDPNLPGLITLNQKRGWVKFICHVEKTRQHRTKNGDLMLFATVNDETGKFDLVIMPNIYAANGAILVKGTYLMVEGTIDRENSCLVKRVSKIETE